LVEGGAAVIVINYDLAPLVGMDEIVRQTRRSIIWSFLNSKSFHGDGNRLFVSGHSAGGHLTASWRPGLIRLMASGHYTC
jgi:arylformamidase